MLRFSQPLDLNRARALCPQSVEQFYHNLESLYQQHNYETLQVWNCDESGAQANKTEEGVVLALRGTRSVHTIVPNERQWISVLVSINSIGHTMPSYYVFKGKRQRQEFISSCENGACIRMQENGYMDAANFNKWMDYFLNYHKSRGNLSLTKRMVLILDGHKSHVTLEVLQKEKAHGLDMVSLPSHISHALQPLDISYFKPFKQSFRAYRDAWRRQNIGKKVGKQELAQWVSLGLQKALTPKNIQNGFRTAGIQPLNKEAMLGKMGAAELFNSSQFSREPNEEDEEPLQTSQEAHHVNVEEILEEGIPSPSRHYTHYYVSVEEDLSIPFLESTMAESNSATPQTSQFLRVPQIQTSFSSRVRSEPLIDYSHSQILTSTDHVGKLTQISEKKAEIERARAIKQKERELTKAKRDQERMAIAAAK